MTALIMLSLLGLVYLWHSHDKQIRELRRKAKFHYAMYDAQLKKFERILEEKNNVE